MPSGVYVRTEKHKKRISGKGNPMYGKKRSQKVKDAISKANKGRLIGSKNPNWKNGIHIGRGGYIYIYSPNHPNATCSKYVRRSHLVMEKHLKRYLTKEEQVHHKGIKYPIDSIENKQDDRIENLKLFANPSGHTKYHPRKRNKLGQFM